NGTISLKRGSLFFTDGHLSGGSFVIDTRSILILDIADPATNAQFASHLASDDFFSSQQYPEALFEIVSAEPREAGSYHVVGKLTIKDLTHPVAFDAHVTRQDQTIHATAKITIDRTKFGMKFRSGNFFTNLGDNLIYNHFDLNVTINAEASVEVAHL
ncbi:MAG TPA: YceI family protein, partial [Chryseosolibacter sp.]